jgi:hypothetical protein
VRSLDGAVLPYGVAKEATYDLMSVPLDPQLACERLTVEQQCHPELGGRRGNLSVGPRKTCPPQVCRYAGRPSSAAPDLTCSLSIALERANYKGPWLSERREAACFPPQVL